MNRHRLRIAAAVLLLLLGVLVTLSYLIDDPLRRYVEGKMNSRLKGYTVRIGALDFHPVGFSLDLRDLVILQNANPYPPVARIPELSASVHWRELLAAHLVADFRMQNPKIYLNLKNVRSEAKDRVPVHERGWQDALQSIYPLKINVFSVSNAEVTYVDEGSYKPLRLSSLSLEARNIRNIRTPERTYPSELHLSGIVFESGRVALDGNANFLAKPHPGLRVNINLEGMDLSYYEPILRRIHLTARKGTLSTRGLLEYAPGRTVLDLAHLTLRGADLDYLHSARTAEKEKKEAEKVGEKAKELSNKPATLLKINQLNIVKSSFGFVNRAADPVYRVFIDDLEMTLKNFSNHFSEGPASLLLTGKFMGSGVTRVSGTFRPEQKGPDFSLNIAIKDTDMRAMNDLLRAYGKFDVVAGFFSLYSELEVKDKAVRGYLKPLFRAMKVYDKRQDKEKSLFRKLYEMLVGGVSRLLENKPRKEVATKADISGRIENPETDTLEVIIRLIQNAFFRAILPGFEREIR